jgi:hypothetical protein
MQLVEVQVTCIRRYAPKLASVPIFLATEMTPADPCVLRILSLENVNHIRLQQSESGFLESRIAALDYMQEFDYVLPLQEDFWLDRTPDVDDALSIMRSDLRVQSIRLMPSPGPHINDIIYKGPWKILSKSDIYKFTFQATLWRSAAYVEFIKAILSGAKAEFESTGLSEADWSKYCIRVNVAENLKGQDIFSRVSMGPNKLHLSIERLHVAPNAVYMCPWPYRPTAVVQGSLEPWAKEFAAREGFILNWH